MSSAGASVSGRGPGGAPRASANAARWAPPPPHPEAPPPLARGCGMAPGTPEVRPTSRGPGRKRSAPAPPAVRVFPAQLDLLDPAGPAPAPPAANELVRPFPRVAGAVASRTL